MLLHLGKLSVDSLDWFAIFTFKFKDLSGASTKSFELFDVVVIKLLLLLTQVPQVLHEFLDLILAFSGVADVVQA
jgi:hypothetical protein